MNTPPNDPAALRRRLLSHGVRPTTKRLQLGALLFDGPCRHLSAEEVWREAQDAGLDVSLATVYNTLNGFVEARLLRLVDLPTARGLYDTNTAPHHHIFDLSTGEVRDLSSDAVDCRLNPGALPGGVSLAGVDILVRVRS